MPLFGCGYILPKIRIKLKKVNGVIHQILYRVTQVAQATQKVRKPAQQLVMPYYYFRVNKPPKQTIFKEMNNVNKPKSPTIRKCACKKVIRS